MLYTFEHSEPQKQRTSQGFWLCWTAVQPKRGARESVLPVGRVQLIYSGAEQAPDKQDPRKAPGG